MTFKILLFLLLLIVAEIYHLIKEGIAEHKFAFGIQKFLVLNTLFLSILSIKSFYTGILLKMKESISPIFIAATKMLITPIKTPKKGQ